MTAPIVPTTTEPPSDNSVAAATTEKPLNEATNSNSRRSLQRRLVISLACMALAVILLAVSLTIVLRPESSNMRGSSTVVDNGTIDVIPEGPLEPRDNTGMDVEETAVLKSSWPELVGTAAKLAEPVILASNNNIEEIQIIPKFSLVTADYKTNRVRLFVNDDAIQSIARTPIVG